MATFKNRYFSSVLDSIEAFEGAGAQPVLSDCIASAMSHFGYEFYCFVLPPGTHQRPFPEKVLIKNWPEGWFNQYVQSNFHPNDPVATFCRSQTKSFPWSRAPIPDGDPTAKEIMAISSGDYRMRHGFCVPIYGIHGHQATISLAGSDIDDVTEATAAIELISIYAFNSLSKLKSISGAKVLTKREKEIVAWAAVGKTAWDIGTILNISAETVNKTMASAMRRLNVHTRAQAVAELIRRGEIVP